MYELKRQLANQIQRSELARYRGQLMLAEKFARLAKQTTVKLQRDGWGITESTIIAGYANPTRYAPTKGTRQ